MLKPIQMFWKTFIIIASLMLGACGSSEGTASGDRSVRESLDEKNRISISLLDQIRRIPGIALRNGVPVFTKNTTDISSSVPIEPLYVLNGYPMGNSFADVDQIVDNINVQKIETMTDSEASFYGSRGANGVILITTKQ
jgi:TonB-dependent SusC/RagA subfamily outer membrane receptor